MQAIETERLRDLLSHHGALGFRRARLSSPEELCAFARCFGSELAKVQGGKECQLYISNGRANTPLELPTPVARGSDFWHSDNSYKAKPAAATILYALECGQSETRTDLCDTEGALAALDAGTRRRIETLSALHDSSHNAGHPQRHAATSAHRAAVHPVVRRHPVTDRPALYVNPLYTARLLEADETPLPLEESAALLAELYHHTLGGGAGTGGGGDASSFCAPFVWQAPGDLLVIDNARSMHRASTLELPHGKTRKLLRVSVCGDSPMYQGPEEVVGAASQP